MTATTKDRIEKEIVIKAPRNRVWRALTTAAEFSEWFGARLDGPLQVGKTVKGQHKDIVFDMTVEKIEPETYFAYRWHPYPLPADVDYSNEPTTLVEFHLKDQPGGTLLTVVESGFDKIPGHRRDLAFRMNNDGWVGQMGNIQRYAEK